MIYSILHKFPITPWKVSKYGVIFDPYFPVFGLNTERFSPNTGKYGSEITPYLDNFHAVSCKELPFKSVKHMNWNSYIKLSIGAFQTTCSLSLVKKVLLKATWFYDNDVTIIF